MSSKADNLILAVNAGSSSLKLAVFKPGNDEDVSLVFKASFTNISSPPASFSFQSVSSAQDNYSAELKQVNDHRSAFRAFLDHLNQSTSSGSDAIKYVCHRIVHGGSFPSPTVINEETYHRLDELSDLAPLHNGPALTVVQECLKTLQSAQSIAFFDTSFHTSIPSYISSYAINPEVSAKKGLKKYGFHGISYFFVTKAVAKHLQKPTEKVNLIILHLGSGASACAVRNGRSLDTSMGLTPVDGLPGATRSGCIDPSLIFHYTNDASSVSHESAEDVHLTHAEDVLNRHSGWKALTGTTDFGQIASRADLQNPSSSDHQAYNLAFHMFLDRVLNYIGSYYLKLGGPSCIDAIVFAGGIGEHSEIFRRAVIDRCEPLGFSLNRTKNSHVEDQENIDKVVVEIGDESAKIRTLMCRTDEQLEMVREWQDSNAKKQ